MGQKRTSRAVAIVVAAWMLAVGAAFALATSANDAVAQQGCTGGGGSPSPSASDSGGGGGLPTQIPPSIPPLTPNGEDAPQAFDPSKKVPVVAAQQDTSCKSTITIAYKSRKKAFTGKVGSGEEMCERGRKVQVRKVKRGPDPLVGRAVTNARGSYTVPHRNPKGKYYAKVAKSTTENDAGEKVTCEAARSQTIRP
jgi:hypothetical protein